MSIPVGIVGFRGYSGAEAIGILGRHPEFEPVLLEHRQDAGEDAKLLRPSGPRRAAASPEAAKAAGVEAVEREGRRIALATMDEVWADYLANEADLRSSLIWTSWSSGDPLHKFLIVERDIYDDFLRSVDEGVATAFAAARVEAGSIEFDHPERLERGATWTYVTTDQPFGLFTERMFKGYLARKKKD